MYISYCLWFDYHNTNFHIQHAELIQAISYIYIIDDLDYPWLYICMIMLRDHIRSNNVSAYIYTV